jgi:hypothetical protein
MYASLPAGSDEQSSGYSYAGLVVRAGREPLLERLARAHFSGWVGPQEGDWVVVVPARPTAERPAAEANLEKLAAELAVQSDDAVLLVTVRRDRLLGLVLWNGRDELGRYLSDPNFGSTSMLDFDEFGFGPQGVEYAESFAEVCGRPEAAEELGETLGNVLDEEKEIESERLGAVLRLLGLPRWLVAARSLPRDVPTGPPAGDFTFLGHGHGGTTGRLYRYLTRMFRRRPPD